MRLTRNFALSRMIDPVVMAPVPSQPSLPFGITEAQRRDLHLTDEELATGKQRVAEQGVKVLGLRFTGDRMCTRSRFNRLRNELPSLLALSIRARSPTAQESERALGASDILARCKLLAS